MSKIENSTDKEDDLVVVDLRFQSFYKCFIIDILNADISKFNDYKVIKIKNLYVSKVSITGHIIAIYELAKMYRCKIDDSTGKINVTIWKDQIYKLTSQDKHPLNSCTNDTNLNDTIFDDDSNVAEEELNTKQKNDMKSLLNAIISRTNDSNVNNSIINRPIQGDLVTIKGYVKCYRDNLEINSLSIYRIKNSNEEYVEMILPIILNDRCYALNQPNRDKIGKQQSDLLIMNKSNQNKENNFIIDDRFLNLVLSRLIQLTSGAKSSKASRQPCNSYSLYVNIRDNYDEFKTITHKNVLDTLKQLEIKCMIYSCDNENSYLPIN